MVKDNKNDLVENLIEFSNIDGISGHENDVANLIIRKLKGIKGIEFDRDNLGSLAVIKKGKGGSSAPTISFTAHMDEVGFMVTEITKTGFVKFSAIGGWWGHVLLGQRLKVVNHSGEEIIGIVGSKPPHLLTSSEAKLVLKIKDLFIDFGATSKEELISWGVNIGDQIIPFQETAFQTPNKNRIIGKAYDDRVAIVAGIEMIKRLANTHHYANIIFIGSVQEEVGLRGARTSSYKWTPNIAFAIDVTFAYDTPGMEVKDTKLGTGVALSLFDSSIIANPQLLRYTENIAKKNKIKYTFDGLVGGGTDAGAIHLTKDGVMTMTLSIPSRYMHSHNTMIDIVDLSETIELMVEFSKSVNNKTINELKF
ncbi:MAG: M20/M25/M40 family metallo-hydrolase [Mycoplasmataceae bacterium]|nr:M20/M25/M40 family metallo-hydrolase [Mycoplasmataceae bacterium]